MRAPPRDRWFNASRPSTGSSSSASSSSSSISSNSASGFRFSSCRIFLLSSANQPQETDRGDSDETRFTPRSVPAGSVIHRSSSDLLSFDFSLGCRICTTWPGVVLEGSAEGANNEESERKSLSSEETEGCFSVLGSSSTVPGTCSWTGASYRRLTRRAGRGGTLGVELADSSAHADSITNPPMLTADSIRRIAA